MLGIGWDIETGPLPDELLRKVVDPFDPNVNCPHPGKFDPSSVKLGRLGEEKAAEKIEQARQAHADAVKEHSKNVESACENYWQDILKKAALSATTGYVCAVGVSEYKTGSKLIVWEPEDPYGFEPQLLEQVWDEWLDPRTQPDLKSGHNIYNFDLPFFVRRSIIRNVPVPASVLENGRYWHKSYLDTMSCWQLGSRDYIKLDTLAKVLGVGGKPDGITGADFHRLMTGTPEELKLAEMYLGNDLDMQMGVTLKILGLQPPEPTVPAEEGEFGI